MSHNPDKALKTLAYLTAQLGSMSHLEKDDQKVATYYYNGGLMMSGLLLGNTRQSQEAILDKVYQIVEDRLTEYRMIDDIDEPVKMATVSVYEEMLLLLIDQKLEIGGTAESLKSLKP